MVLPVYNKQNSIQRVFEIFKNVIENELNIKNYELIFVNDASSDKSAEVLLKIAEHRTVKIINHPVNIGQLKALETGLSQASGDIIIMTACDLQNPIEKSADLYRAVANGFDCGLAYRKTRKERGLKSFFSIIFLWIVSILFSKFPKGGFDFVAINKVVKDALIKKDFDQIFLQLEILRIAKTVYQIPVTRFEDQLDFSSWKFLYRLKYALKIIRYLFK